MAERPRELRPHIVVTETATAERFRPQSGRQPAIPERDQQEHGRALQRQLFESRQRLENAVARQREAGIDGGFGIQIEFQGQPDVELAFESLSRKREGIELLNVRRDGEIAYATVFVPEGKLGVFERIINEYIDERSINGRIRDNRSLVATIQSIRAATFETLWGDSREQIPANEDDSTWWEIWLTAGNARAVTLDRFHIVAAGIGLTTSDRVINFLERTVILVRGTKRQLSDNLLLLNHVAEIRKAKETAEFFDSLELADQQLWAEDLLARSEFGDAGAPAVCLLDTGINHLNPLLAPAISAPDMHTNNPAWGVHDDHGHGTGLAGLSLYGDLIAPLQGGAPVRIMHRLESVKLLPHGGSNHGQNFGSLTIEAVARPEVAVPGRARVFGMAVTAADGRDQGRPSAWSASVDALAFDSLGDGTNKRLFVLAAGNTNPDQRHLYPAMNETSSVHDPGQAWNAITVGAYTEKTRIVEPDAANYQPIASEGGLSPSSSTSLTWQRVWPYKPDVVLEGGNDGRDGNFVSSFPSLSLLTTHHQPTANLFTTSAETSAATALCSRLAARILAQYPTLWPETVRAMVVHSAQWTDRMREEFLPPNPTKRDYTNLIRRCGYGVPNEDRAIWSMSNSLSLVAQDSLQPFFREDGGEPQSGHMNIHRLPWPRDALLALGETRVEMRVTLSYFIEPNPGVAERGTKGRYRYESHGLRFDVRRAHESDREFQTRVNLLARNLDENPDTGGNDPDWILGIRRRALGSLHCDTWTGTAADLANRGVLAVFPALGWWKTNKSHHRYNDTARYSLVVSIESPRNDVDLYTIVANQIRTPVATRT